MCDGSLTDLAGWLGQHSPPFALNVTPGYYLDVAQGCVLPKILIEPHSLAA